MIDRLIYHLELENPEEVSKWEDGFMEEIKKRGEDFKAYQDQYGEHPDEREAKLNQITEKLADVTTLTTIYQGMKEKVRTSLVWMFFGIWNNSLGFQNAKVEAIRIPVNQDKAPNEECFDQILALLKNTSASTPIVFNCQVSVYHQWWSRWSWFSHPYF